jgi:isoleucyl-tRNA synthetase
LDPEGDRAAGLATLREVLSISARFLAPLAPFTAEILWHRIHPTGEKPESVHLQQFPKAGAAHEHDAALEESMGVVLTAARLARVLRERNKIRTTVPLASLRVLKPQFGAAARALFDDVKELLADEVNVDAVELVSDASGLATYKAKPNFPVLGKKVGKHMKAIQAKIDALAPAQIEILRSGGPLSLEVEGQTYSLAGDDVKIVTEAVAGLVVEMGDGMTVALDTAIDEARLDRARAREFKRAVNQARRDASFGLSESCVVELLDSPEAARLLKALEADRRAWLSDLRASDVRVEPDGRSGWSACELLDGEKVSFVVKRAK